MFVVNDDLSIYCTRGDICDIPVAHDFVSGDVVRFKVTKKKDCNTVVLQRDFVVNAPVDAFTISLTGKDTKIGEVISKPTDFWYEVEKNPDTTPETIIGYDEDGAKVFRLFPEGKDVDGDDIEVVGTKTLQELVDYALEQAKESGEFDGEKGDRGEKGEKGDTGATGSQGPKGDSGADGKTPQKGIDYFTKADKEEVLTSTDLTDDQKAKARGNIGAASVEDLEAFRKVAAALAIVCEASGEVIAVSDSSNLQMQGLTLYGKMTQDVTPTPETPVELVRVGNSGSVGVSMSAAGANLFKASLDGIYLYGAYGLSFIDDNTVSGLTSSGGGESYIRFFAKYSSGTYTLSSTGKTNRKFIWAYDASGNNISNSISIPGMSYNVYCNGFYTDTQTLSVVIPSSVAYWKFGISLSYSASTTVDTTSNIQVSYGADVPYKPYEEPQTLTAQTPNGLPGIPVSTGGNYTDSTGQQWICDYKDYARGVYVQRISTPQKITYTDKADTGNANVKRFNSWTAPVPKMATRGILSTHFEGKGWLWNNLLTDTTEAVCVNPTAQLVSVFTASMADYTVAEFNNFITANNVMFQYVLATPIETPLSAEELAQYAALHTNKPNTTVFNDSGAGMKVEYIADTKAYIDNKFAELAAVIVNNV